MIYEAIGVLSALIFILGDIPYLIDTVKAKIKPQRVTWGIVCALNAINFVNQYASGARNSLWLIGAGVIMTGLIFLTSLKNGVGGYAKLDIISIVLALIGIILWPTFDSPLYSVLANILVAVIALIPTYLKSYRQPETENGSAFLFGSISAVLAAISVGKIDFILLVLPIASAILQGIMVYLLYFRPKHTTAASSS